VRGVPERGGRGRCNPGEGGRERPHPLTRPQPVPGRNPNLSHRPPLSRAAHRNNQDVGREPRSRSRQPGTATPPSSLEFLRYQVTQFVGHLIGCAGALRVDDHAGK